MTNRIKKLIKKKQRVYNRAKKFDKEEDWTEFKELRKQVKSELQSSIEII